MRLKKINMEYSFLRFLQHLFLTGGQREPKESGGKCEHLRCSRVFAYEEAMVKFYVSSFKYYSVSVLSMNDERVQDALKRWE